MKSVINRVNIHNKQNLLKKEKFARKIRKNLIKYLATEPMESLHQSMCLLIVIVYLKIFVGAYQYHLMRFVVQMSRLVL